MKRVVLALVVALAVCGAATVDGAAGPTARPPSPSSSPTAKPVVVAAPVMAGATNGATTHPTMGGGGGGGGGGAPYQPHVTCRASYTALARCVHDHFDAAADELVATYDTNDVPGLQATEFSRAAHALRHDAYTLMRDCMTATTYVARRRAELRRELATAASSSGGGGGGGGGSGSGDDAVRVALLETQRAAHDKDIREREGLSTESVFQWRVNEDERNPFLFNHLQQTAGINVAAAAAHQSGADALAFARRDAHYRQHAPAVPSPRFFESSSRGRALLRAHAFNTTSSTAAAAVVPVSQTAAEYSVWLEHTHGVTARSAHTDRLVHAHRARSRERIRFGAHSSAKSKLRARVRTLSQAMAHDVISQRARTATGMKGMDDDGGGWGEEEQTTLQPEVQRLSETIAGGGYEFMIHGLRLALHDNLRHSTNHTVHRKVSRALTKTLTVSLTDALTNLLLLSLSKPYVENTARIVTHSVTPALTFSLSAIVTNALTRRPQEDYYCDICKQEELYCIYCRRSREHQYQHDYYSHYYAHYFSKYYGRFYALQPDITHWAYFNGKRG